MKIDLGSLSEIVNEHTDRTLGLSNIVARDSKISVIKISIIDPDKEPDSGHDQIQIVLSFSNEGEGKPLTSICQFNSPFWMPNAFGILAKIVMGDYNVDQQENSVHFVKRFELDVKLEDILIEYKKLETVVKDIIKLYQAEGFELV